MLTTANDLLWSVFLLNRFFIMFRVHHVSRHFLSHCLDSFLAVKRQEGRSPGPLNGLVHFEVIINERVRMFALYRSPTRCYCCFCFRVTWVRLQSGSVLIPGPTSPDPSQPPILLLYSKWSKWIVSVCVRSNLNKIRHTCQVEVNVKFLFQHTWTPPILIAHCHCRAGQTRGLSLGQRWKRRQTQ